MSMTEEELLQTLSGLGGGPSSEESLDYARQILRREMMGMPGAETDAMERMREQQESVKDALLASQERLKSMQGPSRAELLLAMSAGFGAPTRTGAFGETAANVARQIAPIAQQQREFEMLQGQELDKLNLALAQADMPLIEAEMRLGELEREIQGRLAQEALKTIAKGRGSGRGGGTREAKIQDFMQQYGRTRAEAVAVVDGHVNLDVVEGLGVVRLTDAINNKAYEIPLDPEGVQALERYFPNDDANRPPSQTKDSRETQNVDYRTDEEKLADELVMARIEAGDSLWDMAGVATGPWAQARVGGSYLTSIFGTDRWVATKTIEGRQGLKIRSRDLARALIDNPRMPVRLVEMALEDAAMSPSVLDTPSLMQTRLVALDRELWDRYLDAVQDSNDLSLGASTREAQKANARALQIFLRDLRVPVEEQKRRVRELPSGVPRESEGGIREQSKFDNPPPGFAGTELEWKLMPMDHREAWAEFYPD